jgi:SAM-dependent methyltransferase
MAARFLLPWFGGSPSVWSTCLLFFQTALLVGYVYAHLTKRFGLPTQAKVHVALLLLAVATLPIIPSPSWKPADASHPVGRILLLLTATVGLPYVLLAATAPMAQNWFARAGAARDFVAGRTYPVYWLYALSNLGSLLGLFAYPVAIERLLSIRAQALFWSAGFVVFCGVCTLAAVQIMRLPPQPRTATEAEAAVDGVRWPDMVMWILLSCTGTGLLLAITNELCQDVAVVPLLWIVPLGVYLLTFILCFSGAYRRWFWMWILLAAVGAAAYLAHVDEPPFAASVATLLVMLFAGCMVCHGELVSIRPSPKHLTAFYLAIAAGGGFGGVAVAIVAPLVLTRLWEYQFFAMLPFTLLLVSAFRDPRSRLNRGYWRLGWLPLTAALVVSGVALVKPAALEDTTEIARTRNFYGVLTVLEDPPGADALRTLKNGRILHGAQFVDPTRRSEATSYYGEGSGIELAIDLHPRRLEQEALRIGVIGLGAGTIAALGAPGDTVRFYEINPAAVDFSRRYFTFLSDSRAKVEIVQGDARLSLERELRSPSARHQYDVLAIDAFSGDAIPVHLLTREAFAIYRDALRDDGILAVHVSNRYLDLKPVVRGLAAEMPRKVLTIEATDDDERALDSSTWMLVTDNADFIDSATEYADASVSSAKTIVWTDAFSSVLQVLKK